MIGIAHRSRAPAADVGSSNVQLIGKYEPDLLIADEENVSGACVFG